MSYGLQVPPVPTYGAEIDAVLGQLLDQLVGPNVSNSSTQPYHGGAGTRTQDPGPTAPRSQQGQDVPDSALSTALQQLVAHGAASVHSVLDSTTNSQPNSAAAAPHPRASCSMQPTMQLPGLNAASSSRVATAQQQRDVIQSMPSLATLLQSVATAQPAQPAAGTASAGAGASDEQVLQLLLGALGGGTTAATLQAPAAPPALAAQTRGPTASFSPSLLPPGSGGTSAAVVSSLGAGSAPHRPPLSAAAAAALSSHPSAPAAAGAFDGFDYLLEPLQLRSGAVPVVGRGGPLVRPTLSLSHGVGASAMAVYVRPMKPSTTKPKKMQMLETQVATASAVNDNLRAQVEELQGDHAVIRRRLEELQFVLCLLQETNRRLRSEYDRNRGAFAALSSQLVQQQQRQEQEKQRQEQEKRQQEQIVQLLTQLLPQLIQQQQQQQAP